MNSRTEIAETDVRCPWESGELGGSVEHAKPVSQEREAAVDEAMGLQMISIRLPKTLLADLKFLAEREGLGYQPLIRRVLIRYASHEFKMQAMEQFVSTKGETVSQAHEDEGELTRAACAG
ncbi:MAG: hypothetical protein ACOY9B_08250 [Pseudomonadota bacterium]